MVHFKQEKCKFLAHFILFWENFFFISSSVLRNIKMDFGHKSSFTILVIFQMIVFFQKTYMYYTHTCLFEWKNSSNCFLWNHMNRTLHIELKWDNELIRNIWLNTSSNLVIFWMIFEVYFTLYYIGTISIFSLIYFSTI